MCYNIPIYKIKIKTTRYVNKIEQTWNKFSEVQSFSVKLHQYLIGSYYGLVGQLLSVSLSEVQSVSISISQLAYIAVIKQHRDTVGELAIHTVTLCSHGFEPQQELWKETVLFEFLYRRTTNRRKFATVL